MTALIALSVVGMVIAVPLLVAGLYELATAEHRRLQARIARVSDPTRRHPATPAEALRSQQRVILRFLDARLTGSRWAQRTQLELRRAGSRLQVSEYLVLRIGLAGVLGVVPLFTLGVTAPGLVAMAALGLLSWLLPALYVGRRRGKRMSRLTDQLDEALIHIASSLKAGLGLAQAVTAAAQQLAPPIADELLETVEDMNLGATAEHAFRSLGERIGGHDIGIVVTAVLVQREIGGNLAEILEKVAGTLRERKRLRGEMNSLTAQQRLSAILVATIPVLLALVITATNFDFMEPLFTTTLGQTLMAVALAMEVMGVLVMRRLVQIDY